MRKELYLVKSVSEDICGVVLEDDMAEFQTSEEAFKFINKAHSRLVSKLDLKIFKNSEIKITSGTGHLEVSNIPWYLQETINDILGYSGYGVRISIQKVLIEKCENVIQFSYNSGAAWEWKRRAA